MNDQNSMSRRFLSSTNSLLLLMLLRMPRETSAATDFGNETDRLVLLDFKDQISDDPNEILKSWNDSQHHCKWLGVTCDSQHQRVVHLNLSGQSLLGVISPHIGNLSFLKYINLRDNRFHGEIPKQIGRLRRLRYLYLRNNTLGGEIPANLSNCLQLRVMEALWNRLVGNIPLELGSLKKLEALLIGNNNLTGEIPRSIGNLTSLTQIYLANNNFEGHLPEELGRLTSLYSIGIDGNSFSGMIPSSIYNITSIAGISAPDNFLQGSLPANIGFTLPKIQDFLIGGNRFEGNIPASFANASLLERLDLVGNKFSGQVPSNLGSLQNLHWFNVAGNLLGSNSTGDFDFIASLSNCSNLQALLLSENNFGGKLHNFIGNLSLQLGQLDLAMNQISGQIPGELENLANLFLLGMDHNLFSGSIPSFFGKFQALQKLYLNNNKLSGQIPSSLFNFTSLYGLYLSDNRLEGNIPNTMGNAQSLNELYISQNNLSGIIPSDTFSLSSLSVLNLSDNFLSGSLPPEIGELENIYILDISENKLSGEIPETLGDCLSLEYVNMQGNSFQGTIPLSLASLRGIRVLDLSRNNLTGQIPNDLVLLPFVEFMNLSFNNLEGEVATDGLFTNASSISLAGNTKLCGGIPQLQLPSCPGDSKKRRKPLVLWLIIPTLVAVLILVALFSFVIFYCRRNRTSSSLVPSGNFSSISYHELHKATDGFSSTNLIGSGGSGAVYKGKLHLQHEQLVAVKVLDLGKNGASKSFVAECIALRNIRHRNLVRILTCCSGNDLRGREFKALIYNFMSNGDLDMWLHRSSDKMNTSKNLNMVQRLNIAIDVAFALDYLHNYCETSIVHCDLKPSNVLLDDNFTAKVGDFGLARLLYESTGNPSDQLTGSIGMRGSLGYAAPEYGMGGRASTLGDVYSFGILLLEMFTGRRPTDDLFKDGFNLHEYVKIALPQVLKIVDPLLLASEEDQTDTSTMILQIGEGMHQCLLSIFALGLSCSSEFPRERKNMKDVANQLNIIKKEFLAGTKKITSA